MLLRWSRVLSAWLLALAMALVVVPRTAFHDCSHGLPHGEPEAGATVQADAHCPICEAPVPLTDALLEIDAVPLTTVCAEVAVGRLEVWVTMPGRAREARGPPQVRSAAA